MDLKQLSHFWKKANKQRTRLKIQLIFYVNQVFPKLQYFSTLASIKKLFMPF